MTEKPVEIVTVHGTFAGDEADKGEKWWQQGSEFLTKLQMCIKEPLSIRPFHWDGANSELSRRQAGYRLFEQLKGDKKKPIVIAHSHGGSLSVHALAQMLISGVRSPREKITGLVTIGMPMFRFRTNYNPFTKFSIFGRILLIVALGVLSMFVGDVTRETREYGRAGDPSPLTSALQADVAPYPLLFAAIAIFVALWLFSRRNGQRSKLYKQNKVCRTYGRSVTSLSHPRDEAINALKKGRTLNPKLVGFSSIFGPLFAVFAFFLVLLEFASDFADTVSTAKFMEGGTIVGTVRDPFVFPTGTPRWGVQFDKNQETAAVRAARRQGIEIETAGDDGRLFEQGTLFRLVHSTQLATREKLVALPLADLWSGVSAEVPAWLSPLKAPADNGIGFAFVPEDDANDFRTAFVTAMERVIEAGEAAYIEEACRKAYFTQDAFKEEDRDFIAFLQFDACSFAPLDLASQEAYMSYNVFFKAMNQQANLDLAYLAAAKQPNFVQVPAASWPIRMVNFPTALFALQAADQIPTLDLDDRILEDNTHLITNRWSAFVGDLCNADRDFRRVTDICRLAYESRGHTILHHILYFTDNFTLALEPYLPEGFGRYLTLSTEGQLVETTVSDQAGIDLAKIATKIIWMVVLGAIFAVVASFILVPLLQGFVVGTLKKNSFGNDGHGETLADVAPSIDFDIETPGNLPDAIVAEMDENSRKDAPAAIDRLRALLSAGDYGALGNGDALSTATKFDKSELIHNAYFHSDKFIKYLAAVLVTRYGLTPTAEMVDDKDGSVFLEQMAQKNGGLTQSATSAFAQISQAWNRVWHRFTV